MAVDFPAPLGPQETVDLPRLRLQGNALQGDNVAVGLLQVLDLDHLSGDNWTFHRSGARKPLYPSQAFQNTVTIHG